MASDRVVENGRAAARNRTVKAGQVVLGGSPLNRAILDLSGGGARCIAERPRTSQTR